MALITGWVFVIGCAVGTPSADCVETQANGYLYETQQDCVMDNTSDPRKNTYCVEALIMRNDNDPTEGGIETVLDSLDDSAGGK